MQHSLESIARLVDGELLGSGDLLLSNISFLDEANANEIAFAITKNDFQDIEPEGFCMAGAVIVPTRYKGSRANIIKVDNMQLAIARTIALFHPKEAVHSILLHVIG